jgi:hypothetical protein
LVVEVAGRVEMVQDRAGGPQDVRSAGMSVGRGGGEQLLGVFSGPEQCKRVSACEGVVPGVDIAVAAPMRVVSSSSPPLLRVPDVSAASSRRSGLGPKWAPGPALTDRLVW